MQLQQSVDIWSRDDVQVVVLSFESPELLSRLAESFPDSWHFVADSDRSLYAAYGAGEASLLQLFSPRTIWIYLRALVGGRLVKTRSRGDGGNPDTAQLGGDFVIGADGRVKLAWSSTTPADRPGMEVLREALHG